MYLTDPVHLHGLINGFDAVALWEKQTLQDRDSPSPSTDSHSWSSRPSASSGGLSGSI
jgi:hypothetical protein